MFYVMVFAAGDDAQFERVMPLEFQGRYLKERGWVNPITIVFMAGFDRLSDAYVQRLRDLGYTVMNEQAAMDAVRARYARISTLSPYFAFTYLRWLLLADLVARGKAAFPHALLDGDLLMTADPAQVFADVAGKTFLLQGCPCFTAIGDMGWYAAYEAELDKFTKDPVRYGADAESVRANPARADRDYCNASVFELPFRHEQDFQQYLIAKGLLPQDRTETALGNHYYWIQNPLFPSAWAAEQSDRGELTWRDGQLWNGDRAVPFVHFQNDFADYCARWFAVNAIPGASRLTVKLRGAIASNRLFSGLVHRSRSYRRSYSRAAMYERAMALPADGSAPAIVDIINSRW